MSSAGKHKMSRIDVPKPEELHLAKMSAVRNMNVKLYRVRVSCRHSSQVLHHTYLVRDYNDIYCMHGRQREEERRNNDCNLHTLEAELSDDVHTLLTSLMLAMPYSSDLWPW